MSHNWENGPYTSDELHPVKSREDLELRETLKEINQQIFKPDKIINRIFAREKKKERRRRARIKNGKAAT